ncbi:MAG: 16S rRNA pseudouridine(516) synthase [Oscillospiraceae bacterium]|jgi:16S rRNA pseudouridine516 synthase|nr:16S rRNA pseudouridine(516) synthase [Oscillospiraceae bacterium]
MPWVRIDALLASRGFGSRKEVLALIKSGAVTINGQRALKGGQKFNDESAAVTINGTAVDLREHAYLMLHKPKGCVCAARDPRAETVMALIPEPLRRRGLFPAGRLDKDTTGLLLITDDGALAHRLLSPRRHVEKVYLAALKLPAREEDAAAFAAGMRLPAQEGRPPEDCLPARLELLPGNRARVVLHEGKYHQVKRMFRALGNEVTQLHRERFGPLALDESLAAGECRALTEAEIAALKNA